MDDRSLSSAYILCELAGATYGVSSSVVQRVEMIEQITPMPNAPVYVEGVVFSQGQVIPALNLRVRFGFAPIPYTLRSRLIVVRVGGRVVGLIVDTAREFVTIAAELLRPLPESLAGPQDRFIAHVAAFEKRLVLILDVDEVLQAEDTLVLAPETE